jgi:glucosamine-phosphate N-acetyltransferase
MYIRAAILEDLNNGLLDLLQEFGELKEKSKKHIDIAFLAASGVIFVMIDGNRVIGTGTLIIDQKLLNSKRAARIEEVVIAEDRRGEGLGKELIGFLVEQAQLRLCYKVILNCSDENVGFYEKCGLYHNSNCMRIDLIK